MTHGLPRIAITLGDPRGIGPEVVSRTLRQPPVPAWYVVVGPAALLPYLPADHAVAIDPGPPGAAGTLDPACPVLAHLTPAEAGRLAGRAIERAAAMALAGEVDAVVTAPIEKRAVREAGYPWPGHTEWLAALAGGGDVAMMLASDRLRVVLVTTHLALRDVPAALTLDRTVRVGRVTIEGLRRWWGLAAPRVALCALNPHAGEGGLFGTEEQAVLAPAARALGAAGPLPADTVFVRALRGEFDAVLAPYHDVGMTAIKVASFGQAVNVTLGLPFIRTSPDHGTALDIAGRGVADPGSMREAVRLAVELAARRRDRDEAPARPGAPIVPPRTPP